MGRNYNRDPTTGVLSVFDFVQSRKYYGLQIPIPSLVETLASWWTYQKYHTDRYDPNGYIQGRKTGLHLNFIPKYKIQIRRDADGGTIIQLDYWARIRKTGIVAAFVTYGVTAAIGAGTLSYHVMEAKHFLQAFWEWFDGSYQVVKVEVLINEEKTALQEEGYDESGNVSSKSVHNTTTNNYYNTYNQEMPAAGGGGYSTTSTSSKTVVSKSPQSSGVVYPVKSPPKTSTPDPVPYPATAGGGSGSSYSSYNSSSSTSGGKYPAGGYQTTITSHTTSTAPAYGAGVYGTPAYNARFTQPPPVIVGSTTVGYPPGVVGMSPYGAYNSAAAGAYNSAGYGGAYNSAGYGGAYGTGQYGSNSSVAAGGYSNSGYGSSTSGTNQYGSGSGSGNSSNNYSSTSSSASSSSSSSYGNNSYSGVPLDSMSKLSISGQGNTSGTQQQQDKFVQSLFGSEPAHKSTSSSASTNKNLPPPSTATLSGAGAKSNGIDNNGYNSSLPPYPSTASTSAPTPPPISQANLVNNNISPINSSGTNSSTGQYGSGSGSNGNNNINNQNGPYPTGSYLGTGEDKKHQDVDYKSLKHGGLGFGYTYDHLKEELKRKSENLNQTANNPSHGTANN